MCCARARPSSCRCACRRWSTPRAAADLKALLELDPPYNAKVTFKPAAAANGWNAPGLAPRLEQAMNTASRTHSAMTGLYRPGGTIP